MITCGVVGAGVLGCWLVGVLVVTGTGTGVGKTVVTAAIATLALDREFPVAVVKPGQTGVSVDEPGDLDEVVRLCGRSALPGVHATDLLEVHELSRFPDPLAPAAAARHAGRQPYDLRDALAVVRALADSHRLVLVEGAGGLLVRYDDEGTTIADLAHWLAAPTVLVTHPTLGTLNHTALTLEAMAHRGIELGGVVVGAWPDSPDLAARSNVRDLETLAARPLAGAMADGAGTLAPDDFLVQARAGLGPELGGIFDAADFRRRAAG